MHRGRSGTGIILPIKMRIQTLKRVHENDDNDDGHNCHGIDFDNLKKCVTCVKHGKKEQNGRMF